ncbi:hypothetical protein IKF63_00750 [Candidatus Saccharibacteria bacterium]|nr:hypothetical protein [Candidatus Saccharibacteria bacterium]
MMSGNFDWYSGNLSGRGTYGNFWASTPDSYANSRLLHFYSAGVVPKYNDNKPYGLPLRCVALSSLFERRQKQFSMTLANIKKNLGGKTV